MTTTTGPSALEEQLKAIAAAHPWVRVHPHSPSGPHVRAVLWNADPGLLGQALWEPNPGVGPVARIVAHLEHLRATLTDQLT